MLSLTGIVPKRYTRIYERVLRWVPLTRQGILTLALALLALQSFAYGRLDLIVFALAICAVSFIGFSFICVFAGGIYLRKHIARIVAAEVPPDSSKPLEAEFPNETGFSVPPIRYLPLVSVQWAITFPDRIDTRIRARQDGGLVEEAVPLNRCLSDSVTRRFLVRDVLGFCQFQWESTQSRTLFVLPRKNTLRSIPLLRSMTAEDGLPNPAGQPEGDRMEIRPYVAGDSVRNIMWRTYARTGQLNVRLHEKSVFQSRKTLAYLVSSPDDEAVAAVARAAIETGALGEDWEFCADGCEQPTSEVSESLICIARSRALLGSHEYGLDRFLGQGGHSPSSHCIVFASPSIAATDSRFKNTILKNPGQLSIVLATDGLEVTEAPPWWKKALFKQARTESVQSTSPQQLSGILSDLGQQVESRVLVDRRTGNSYDHLMRKV